MPRRRIACLLAGAIAALAPAGARAADGVAPVISADTVKRTRSPTGAEAAFLVGSARGQGLYVISAFYPAGRRGTPHMHSDQRVTTVISGTLYAGTGPTFDETKVEVVHPGGVLITPANTLHWAWARDGDVLVEEVGIGPTGNIFPDAGRP